MFRLKSTIVDNPGRGNCGYYAFIIGLMPYLKEELEGKANYELLQKLFPNVPLSEEMRNYIQEFDYTSAYSQHLFELMITLRRLLFMINEASIIEAIRARDNETQREVMKVFMHYYNRYIDGQEKIEDFAISPDVDVKDFSLKRHIPGPIDIKFACSDEEFNVWQNTGKDGCILFNYLVTEARWEAFRLEVDKDDHKTVDHVTIDPGLPGYNDLEYMAGTQKPNVEKAQKFLQQNSLFRYYITTVKHWAQEIAQYYKGSTERAPLERFVTQRLQDSPLANLNLMRCGVLCDVMEIFNYYYTGKSNQVGLFDSAAGKDKQLCSAISNLAQEIKTQEFKKKAPFSESEIRALIIGNLLKLNVSDSSDRLVDDCPMQKHLAGKLTPGTWATEQDLRDLAEHLQVDIHFIPDANAVTANGRPVVYLQNIMNMHWVTVFQGKFNCKLDIWVTSNEAIPQWVIDNRDSNNILITYQRSTTDSNKIAEAYIYGKACNGAILEHYKTCYFPRGLPRGTFKGKFENRRFSSVN